MQTKIIKTLAITGSVIAFGTMAVMTPSFAQTVDSTAVKNQISEKRCDVITNRIDKRIDNYNKKKPEVIERYNKKKDKVQEEVNKLKDDKGFKYDTTKIEADLKTVDEKIQNLGKDIKDLNSILDESKKLDCGNSNGAFKAQMQKAKNQVETVKNDAKSIKKFFQETIKQDLKDLRAQKK